MLKNYFKIAIRNILRNKIFAIINIGGLSIAMAASFFILIYVVNEFSYDKCHRKRDRIYRVNTNKYDFNVIFATTPYVLAPTIINDFPEVKKTARTNRLRSVKIKNGNELITERNFICADNDIFNIFTLPFVSGSANKHLINDKNSVVISEEMAEKYFGSADPINKLLNAKIRGKDFIFKVTGVMKNIPKNSTFRADFICNIKLSFEQTQMYFHNKDVKSDWDIDFCITYLLLKNYNSKQLESKFPNFEKQYLPEIVKNHYQLQNLSDIYLQSTNLIHSTPQGDLFNVYLYLSIGIILLLIASSNYIILASAVSTTRAKEIGIRKVIGATRKNIIRLVLGESMIISLIAFFFSIVLVEFFHSGAQSLFQYNFDLYNSNYIFYLLGFFTIPILVGFISGIYIAFYLSSFQVVDILKNKTITGKGRSTVRRGLLIFQLMIFSILVFSVIVINNQYQYTQSKDMGFNKENLLMIYLKGDQAPKADVLLNSIKNNVGIINITAASFAPPTSSSMRSKLPAFNNSEKEVEIEGLSVDYNFIETFDMKIIKGRSFSKKFPSDMSSAAILNETAVQELGIKDPIGKEVGGKIIIGVVKDFNLHSFHSKIMPMEISLSDKYIRTIVVRYREGKEKETINYLSGVWEKIVPDIPFDFQTFEEALAEHYEDEKRLQNIMSVSTLLIILIAISGLFGLTLFLTKYRTKEIGVRKVLGASVVSIITLFSKEFLWILFTANLIALPIAYYFMNKWLQNFAYKIEIGIFPFLISIVIVISISLLTIVLQTSKAAIANTVDSIKYE